jgi:diguanylate cyclase (GGDEF)-like protein
LSLLMADVDSFKAYNDTYGHPGGDACLKRVAYALQSGLRRAGDLLARYGGEEFVIILPDMPLDQAAALAEELRLRLRAMQIPHAAAFAAPVVTVSFGAAVCHPQEGGSPADLVAASDRALYRAKKAGRNRVDAG